VFAGPASAGRTKNKGSKGVAMKRLASLETCALFASFCSLVFSDAATGFSTSQLFGVEVGADILMNSYIPVSGQTRYLVGFEYRGFGRVTILAAALAFRGSTNSNGGEGASSGSSYLDFEVGVAEAVAFSFEAEAGLVDLVLAMIDRP
jgi:hypothetical protein